MDLAAKREERVIARMLKNNRVSRLTRPFVGKLRVFCLLRRFIYSGRRFRRRSGVARHKGFDVALRFLGARRRCRVAKKKVKIKVEPDR